jgi:UDP-glucose 4-epimerase
MKVLVTGGAGFVGSHVVGALLSAGHEPHVFDIYRIEQGIFTQGDITHLEEILAATVGIDAIFHLGAIGDVYSAFEDPILAAKVNVMGTANVMQAALYNKIHKVIYASTWEVYGHSRHQPIDERHPCMPDHPYSITKLSGEQITLSYDRLKGVPAVALRLGTAYGLGMRPNSVFSIFIDHARKGQPITIQGDGRQFRQFTHAYDIGRAFVAALESNNHSTAYNIVAEQSISIRQLAEMITAELPTEIAYTQARLGDVRSAIISSEKAKNELGWESLIPFQDGLHEIIHGIAKGDNKSNIKAMGKTLEDYASNNIGLNR